MIFDTAIDLGPQGKSKRLCGIFPGMAGHRAEVTGLHEGVVHALPLIRIMHVRITLWPANRALSDSIYLLCTLV
jgi:hypothetical protein